MYMLVWVKIDEKVLEPCRVPSKKERMKGFRKWRNDPDGRNKKRW